MADTPSVGRPFPRAHLRARHERAPRNQNIQEKLYGGSIERSKYDLVRHAGSHELVSSRIQSQISFVRKGLSPSSSFHFHSSPSACSCASSQSIFSKPLMNPYRMSIILWLILKIVSGRSPSHSTLHERMIPCFDVISAFCCDFEILAGWESVCDPKDLRLSQSQIVWIRCM